MEQSLEERIAFEARRVAVAFGVDEWDRYSRGNWFLGVVESTRVGWVISEETFELKSAEVGPAKGINTILVQRPDKSYGIAIGEVMGDELMAKGLYRLGFEDEGVFSQLPPLSAHEKLELRFSLPREFWPKMWLDEG